MKIEMNRKVDVVAYEVLATLSFPEDRSELLSLLQMAEEFGSLNGDRVVDRKNGLLPGRPRVMGNRLLSMAVDLDLLEQSHGENYNLTDFGKETLGNNTVFVPEEATWTIWVTKDPIFPARILHVERHKEGRSDRNRRPVQTLPSHIIDISDLSIELLRPHHTNSSQLRVKDIKSQGRLSDYKTELNLIIIADIGQQTIARAKGTIGSGKGKQINQRIQFEGPEHEELFIMLMNQSEFGVDWNPDEGVLETGFDELSRTELREHLKTVQIKKPELGDLGSFNSVELKSIPLKARTGHDARRWAEWEFWTDFQGHPWPEQVNASWAPISERFDLLSHGLQGTPSISNRIDELRDLTESSQKHPADLTQLRRCQAIIDIGGESL